MFTIVGKSKTFHSPEDLFFPIGKANQFYLISNTGSRIFSRRF